MLRTGLEVTYEGVTYTVPLSEDPLSVGRAPTNGLSLTDASVSWNHASVWNAGGEVWIRDLNSTNGVFIDGQRVRGDALFPYGATVLLGEHVSLRLTRTSSGEDAHLVLEDPARGRRFAVSEGRTSLAELGFGREAALVVDARSQVRLEVDGEQRAVLLGEDAELLGVRVRVSEVVRVATVGQTAESYPYRLVVRLDAPTGPEAELTDRVAQRHYTINAENRVVLLYMLGRQALADQAAARPPDDVGWCKDDDLAVGIWGKGERSMSALPVLVHRLRKELDRAAFDHSFLEKGRRVMRALLRDVVIDR